MRTLRHTIKAMVLIAIVGLFVGCGNNEADVDFPDTLELDNNTTTTEVEDDTLITVTASAKEVDGKCDAKNAKIIFKWPQGEEVIDFGTIKKGKKKEIVYSIFLSERLALVGDFGEDEVVVPTREEDFDSKNCSAI